MVSKKLMALCNYIILEMEKYNKDKAFRDKVSLHTKRLQKILYFSEVEYMRRNNGKVLFNDEYNAWPSGPVVANVYSFYALYVDGQIKPRYVEKMPNLNDNEKEIIDYVIKKTIDMDTVDLVNLSTLEFPLFNKYYDEDDLMHEQIIPKNEIYNYYKDRELFETLSWDSKYLYQDDIIKLKDKDLQLRYILGGLYPHGGMNCNRYWGCDIKCSTLPVLDDINLEMVKMFIKKHNISNGTFLRLARTYLSGAFNPYDGDYGNLIYELDNVLMRYNFVHTDSDKIPDNDLKEKELLKLIAKQSNVEGTKLNKFLRKYSLTNVDFMILAKTSINYQFKIARGFETTDLSNDLYSILDDNGMYQSYAFVLEYRDNYKNSKVKKRRK